MCLTLLPHTNTRARPGQNKNCLPVLPPQAQAGWIAFPSTDGFSRLCALARFFAATCRRHFSGALFLFDFPRFRYSAGCPIRGAMGMGGRLLVGFPPFFFAQALLGARRRRLEASERKSGSIGSEAKSSTNGAQKKILVYLLTTPAPPPSPPRWSRLFSTFHCPAIRISIRARLVIVVGSRQYGRTKSYDFFVFRYRPVPESRAGATHSMRCNKSWILGVHRTRAGHWSVSNFIGKLKP